MTGSLYLPNVQIFQAQNTAYVGQGSPDSGQRGCTGKGESDGECQNKCEQLHASNFKNSYETYVAKGTYTLLLSGVARTDFL
jgi:hypothetical protein